MPREVLVMTLITCTGAAVAVLIAAVPAAGVPIGSGTAIIGLLFSLWTWHAHTNTDDPDR